MADLWLTTRQALAIYKGKHHNIEGKTYKLVKEKEGELHENKNTEYNSRFERECTWIIEDSKGNRYEGIIFEGGDDMDNMQVIGSDIGFSLISNKPKKLKKKK